MEIRKCSCCGRIISEFDEFNFNGERKYFCKDCKEIAQIDFLTKTYITEVYSALDNSKEKENINNFIKNDLKEKDIVIRGYKYDVLPDICKQIIENSGKALAFTYENIIKPLKIINGIQVNFIKLNEKYSDVFIEIYNNLLQLILVRISSLIYDNNYRIGGIINNIKNNKKQFGNIKSCHCLRIKNASIYEEILIDRPNLSEIIKLSENALSKLEPIINKIKTLRDKSISHFEEFIEEILKENNIINFELNIISNFIRVFFEAIVFSLKPRIVEKYENMDFPYIINIFNQIAGNK